MEDKYEDIINLPHHVSAKHPPMSMEGRAAQFAPFAALTGHSDAIRETARLTDEKIELDESRKCELDDILSYVVSLNEKPVVDIEYFIDDDRKSGGRYDKVTGQIKKVDTVRRSIMMMDGLLIPVDNIIDIVINADLLDD